MANLSRQSEIESRLTEREAREYGIYTRLNQPPMAASASLQFLALFLSGQSCEDIQRLSPNGFSLGAIVRARIDNDWDSQLEEHQRILIENAKDKVNQVTLETIDRVLAELSASNKAVKERALKYIQTGDEKYLEGTGIGSVKHLVQMTEILSRLTGQDSKKSTIVTVQDDRAKTVEGETVEPAGPIKAADALEEIYKARGGK